MKNPDMPFSKVIAPFMPQFVMDGGVVVGNKILFKMHNGRVFSAYFDNSPGQIATMGRGDCLWLKVVNPAGLAPAEIRVDVSSIPFSTVPALYVSRKFLENNQWYYCKPPVPEDLKDVRKTVESYINLWS